MIQIKFSNPDWKDLTADLKAGLREMLAEFAQDAIRSGMLLGLFFGILWLFGITNSFEFNSSSIWGMLGLYVLFTICFSIAKDFRFTFKYKKVDENGDVKSIKFKL